MHRVRLFAERTWGRVLGSDPGLTRLRSTGRTVISLALVLLVLVVLTRATDQPSSGVVVAAVLA